MNRWFDKLPIISKYFSGKIVLSFLMLVLSVVMFFVYMTIDRTLCMFAVVWSFIGDCILNHFPKGNDNSRESIVLGGEAFILAHILFGTAYLIKCNYNQIQFFNLGFWLAVVILVTITIVFLLLGKEKIHEKTFVFGMIYLWVTGVNYINIFSYSYAINSIESIAMLGAIMFLASDTIIGCERFLGLKSKLARELVWWLYPIGQIIIIIMA